MAKNKSMLPSEVKIGIYNYSITEANEAFVYNGRLLDGLIHLNDLQITINTELAPQRAEQVLAHEIVHGIVEHYDIPIEHLEDFEEIVDKLAIGLLQVLKDNPNLFRK